VNSDEWGTPFDFFDDLDTEFDFTLDPCGRLERKLRADLETWDIRHGMDGLKRSWSGHSVFVNPPYSAKQCELWCKKCYTEKDDTKAIVLLIPLAKGSNLYFHKYIYLHAEIRFVRGRLDFTNLDNVSSRGPSPQGSMICVLQH
jgi:site-specific DNA-methyltransferase (adenine-specific)